jgi:trk system potassium uptake protein TrkH
MMLVPLPFSFFYGDNQHWAFLISSLITLSAGSVSLLLTRKFKEDIRAKEGFAIVTFSWILFAALGSLPFVISGSINSYADAFFETMSGFTTTGASILADIEKLPKSILFWRSFTHWLGGMGIIVLTIAILPFLGIGGMQLFKAEVPGLVVDKLTPRITGTAKILWGVYVIFTVVQVLLLMFAGMDLFDSLCHTFGTMATGGFSTKNSSIAYYNSPFIDFIIIFFMIIAGINFSLHYKILTGNFREMFVNIELRSFLLVILTSTIIISLQLFFNQNYSLYDSFRYGLFQVTSIITTTGFAIADFEKWSTSSNVILIILMFIGGSSGSTAGGLKVIRVVLLFKFAYNELKRLLHPNAISLVKFSDNIIDEKILLNVSGFFVIYIAITIISTLILAASGSDFMTSISAVAATINNVGPGFGKVGPIENYGHFPDYIKWLLSFLMMIGRLEIYTVILLLSPIYWKK